MLLRGMGYLKAYEYALAHGADVLSLSYMWEDMPLGHYRGVYRTVPSTCRRRASSPSVGRGITPVYDGGRRSPCPKTSPRDHRGRHHGRREKADESSEGPCTWDGVKFYEDYPPSLPLAKPDVTGVFGGFPRGAAGEWFDLLEGERPDGAGRRPGRQLLHRVQTAGVAALMLSANPDLCPWEVKAIMEKTCRDLGRKGRDYTFGAGLLQARRDAVRAARAVAR